MQIMFIRVVCGRIILRCLIVKTIIFDKCLFMGERRRFAVCLFRNPTLNGCRISHKQPLKHKCRNRQKAICNNYGGFIKAELFVVNARIIKIDLFYCCLRTVLFDVLKNGNSARLFGIMLHVKQDLSHCRILQKE